MAVTAALLAVLAVLLALPPPTRPWPAAARSPTGGDGGAGPHRPPGRGAGHASVQPLRAVAVCGIGLGVLLLVPGTVGVVGACVASVALWWRSSRWESAAVRRRRARLESDLPHVVDLLVASMASGAAPGAALRQVAGAVGAPSSEELAVWVARLELGAEPVRVWEAMAAHPQLGRLGAALHRAAEGGAPVGEALARLAADLRSRRRADVETRVRQVEVKAAVPLGVCLLPAFVLVGVVPLVAGSVTGLVLR